MASDRLAGTDNVIRFPIEERARPTLGLMRELAPDVRGVELTAEAFGLALPSADFRHRVDGEAGEYIMNNIDARPGGARVAAGGEGRGGCAAARGASARRACLWTRTCAMRRRKALRGRFAWRAVARRGCRTTFIRRRKLSSSAQTEGRHEPGEIAAPCRDLASVANSVRTRPAGQ